MLAAPAPGPPCISYPNSSLATEHRREQEIGELAMGVGVGRPVEIGRRQARIASARRAARTIPVSSSAVSPR